jgi:hypothetical protein
MGSEVLMVDANGARIIDFVLTGEDLRTVTGLTRPNGRLISPKSLVPDWNR